MTAAATVVGGGKYIYEMREDRARPPQGCEMMAASVRVDSRDRAYCGKSTQKHPVAVFDRDGNFLSS